MAIRMAGLSRRGQNCAMRKLALIAAATCGLGAAAVAHAQGWRPEPAPIRPGGIETCAVRWPTLGLAVMLSRWKDGTESALLSVAEANPKGWLELVIDGRRFTARTTNLRYWAQPEVVAALLDGATLHVDFLDREGKPKRAEVDLASLKAAYEACQEALGPAPSTASAKPR